MYAVMRIAKLKTMGEIGATAMAFALGLVGGTMPVHASGVTVVPPDKTGNIWALAGNDPRFQSTVIQTQVPGCMEGPCPVDVIAVFSSGHAEVIQGVAPVAEVARVGAVQYVVATGLCQYGGCELGAYAVNRQREATAPLLVRAHIDLSKARCGLPFAYAGGTYMLKPVLVSGQGAGAYYLPRVIAGAPACK